MTRVLQTAQEIYAAFGRGDIPAIISQLDEQVKWEAWESHSAQQAVDVPWLRPGTGKAAALRFFEEVGRMKFEEFRVISMLANDHQVAVEAVLDAVLPNGKRLRDEEIHLWNFNDAGKVIRFRHYADTAKHIAAAG